MTQHGERPREHSRGGPAGVPRSAAYAPEVTLLEWTTSLRRRKPKTFYTGILATVAGLALVWWAFREAGAVLLAALLLGGALGPLYFPTTFRLTDKKAYQRILFSVDGHRWQDFDEYHVFSDGVYLHLRPTDLRHRYLKGLTLYFGPDNRQEVLDIIRQRMTADSTSDAAR